MSQRREGPGVSPHMTNTPIATPTVAAPEREDVDALVLELHRLAARLSRANVITSDAATALMRTVNQGRRELEKKRSALAELVFTIVRSLSDGALTEGKDFRLLEGDRVALHPDSVARQLFQVGRSQHTAGVVRALFRFGAQHFGSVVVGLSERVRFSADDGRRRAVVLHLPAAHTFVGGRPPRVPSR